MIQKIKLIEQVKHRLEGEAETKNLGKLHPKMIEQWISRAYNTLLVQALQRNTTDLSSYSKTYVNVDILYDQDIRVYYSVLPANIVMIPRLAGNGIIRIENMRDDGINYVPITNNELQSIVGLEVDNVDDVIEYVFKNGRVEYRNITTIQGSSSVSVEDVVRMELVITFESYSDTDILQIPAGADQVLTEMVVNYAIGTPDSDNLNNNNSLNRNTVR
jgi:hypothetical protein